jgi:quinoprotein glucose dehydrogenase
MTPIGLIEPPAGFETDVRYVAGQAGAAFRVAEAAGAGSYADAPTAGRGALVPAGRGNAPAAGRANAPAGRANGGNRGGTTVQGLSILKPPYSTISAISMSKGEILWQIPHGDTPDNIRNNPALKGINIPKTGQNGWNIGTLVTKTLLVAGDGQVTTTPEHPRGAMLRAYDKSTGKQLGEVLMPAPQSGSPMTYSVNGKQYIVVATSGGNASGEYIAFSVPSEAKTTNQARQQR